MESGTAVESALAEKRRFHPLTVARIVRETSDARSIVFDVPRHLRSLFEYQAGQFLTLEVEHEGTRLRRCYSLASSPARDEEHKVTVKRVAGGRISNLLNERLREGDILSVLPPEGRFVLGKSSASLPLLLFAGGSGITPVISLAKTALATTARSVRLVYANRDAASVIFAAELDALARRYPGRFDTIHRFDDVHGFVDAAVVRNAVTRLDAECYLCGPSPFMTTVEQALAAHGFDAGRIHVERFVSPADAPKVAGDGAKAKSESGGELPNEIAVVLEGRRHLVPYAAGKSILRAVLDAGLAAPYSCEEGFCGCCVAKLHKGVVDMDADDALTPEEKARGFVLTCQAKPRTRECAVEYLEGV
jgi:3-ketosteroid 9alpha-monooxygenase subunit B